MCSFNICGVTMTTRVVHALLHLYYILMQEFCEQATLLTESTKLLVW